MSFSLFLSIYFLFRRFHSVAGFSFSQVLLSFSVVMMAFSLSEVFFRGFDLFPQMLGTGEFDRILVRPRSILFQLLCEKIKLTMAPRLLQAALMLVWSISAGAVQWTAAKAVVLTLMILCGAALFFGLFLINAALCFFTLESLEVMNIFTDGPREYGKYPFGIYGKGVLWILTLLVPLALVQYWPLQYLLDRGPGWYGLLPLLSLLFLIPCTALWRLGVRHYRSTGS